jgi:hypothetical protein
VDAVELARRSAAALHATAVAAGHDPCHPYAFAVAIADLRGLDVEPSKPGAAILDGGRATLIPKDDLIVHEKRGTDFERAFLVAHEIGHAELGDRRDPTDGTVVDPARSSEPAPIGPDRVDYSRRQRREVQMDLFARELLLPRPVLHDMYDQPVSRPSWAHPFQAEHAGGSSQIGLSPWDREHARLYFGRSRAVGRDP